MSDAQVNIIAVIIAAAIYFGLGWLWYSPKMFGAAWLKEVGLKELKKDKTSLVGEALIGLIIASVLALFMGMTHSVSTLGGFKIGFLSWLGFVASTHLSGVLWGRKTLTMFYISSGFLLTAYLLMGMVIGLIS